MMKRIVLIIMTLCMLQACRKVPVTGRSQLSLVGDEAINNMAEQQYNMVLDQSRVIKGTENARMVDRVGERIENAVVRYMKANGAYDAIKDWNWEYHLIDEGVANAWCMPGGKVAFYTGILPITEDEKGMAVVMGHEIAHAIAHHGAERMSQQMGVQILGLAGAIATSGQDYQTRQTFNQAFGLGSQLGMLAYSRKHESEADRMGLIFMAMAGYDPREAVDFWKRMSKQGGPKPPEFVSTHPSDERRIADLELHMEEALRYYKPRTNISN